MRKTYRWGLALLSLLLIALMIFSACKKKDPTDEILGLLSSDKFNTNVPCVIFTANNIQQGGLLYSKADTAVTDNFLTIKEIDSLIIEYDRKGDADVVYLDLDDRLIDLYKGKQVGLSVYCYVTVSSTLSVTYRDVSGNETSRDGKTGLTKDWGYVTIPLSNCAFDASEGGHDIKLTFKGDDYLRIAYIGIVDIKDEVANATEAPTLIQSKFDSTQYYVAETSVYYYGAVGDGVTDDTAAFKSAIDYVASIGGGAVYVPAGKYVLTSSIYVNPKVQLIGELNPEGDYTDSTVLMIQWGAGETKNAAFVLDTQAALQHLAIWYPDQKIENGRPVIYPCTIKQNGGWQESCTVENVVLVNSYIGFDFSQGDNISLMSIKNVKGTCLSIGLEMKDCYDISRLENITFSASAWLASGLGNTPDEATLKAYMQAHVSGFIIGRVDWTYMEGITANDCYKGMVMLPFGEGCPCGSTIDFTSENSYYGLYIEGFSDPGVVITGLNLKATGDSGARCVMINATNGASISLINGTMTSEGDYAIESFSKGSVILEGCILSGAKEGFSGDSYKRVSFLNTVSNNQASEIKAYTDSDAGFSLSDYDYDKVVTCKPASDKFINMSTAYELKTGYDIAPQLQEAIDSLKGVGGTVYLPAGEYRLENPITVWEGIEIRGCQDDFHYISGTVIRTDYGCDDVDGTALITLMSGAGLRGMSFYYDKISATAVVPYAYLVRGNGSGCYAVSTGMNAYNGFDFFTNQCDNHYIEDLWGTCINTVVRVGGNSTGGIIRDVHFNIGAWQNDHFSVQDSISYLKKNADQFILENCTDEIMYHCFTFGSRQGLYLGENVKNAFILCIGFDSGNRDIVLDKNAEALIVNPQLVVFDGADNIYIIAEDTFTGKVEIAGFLIWGGPKKTIEISGEGTFLAYAGVCLASATNFAIFEGGTSKFICNVNLSAGCRYQFMIKSGVEHVTAFGNIYYGNNRYRSQASESQVSIDMN